MRARAIESSIVKGNIMFIAAVLDIESSFILKRNSKEEITVGIETIKTTKSSLSKIIVVLAWQKENSFDCFKDEER